MKWKKTSELFKRVQRPQNVWYISTKGTTVDDLPTTHIFPNLICLRFFWCSESTLRYRPPLLNGRLAVDVMAAVSRSDGYASTVSLDWARQYERQTAMVWYQNHSFNHVCWSETLLELGLPQR